MGWYTSGPGDVEYKYGDVVEAASSSGLGRLTVVPRIYNGDIDLGDLEFLGRAQRAAIKRGLPWSPLDFDLEVDSSGESLVVPLDVDVSALLGTIAEHVEAHGATLRALVGREDEGDEGLSELSVSLEFAWEVGQEQRDALLAWLNGPLKAPVTWEALGRGALDDYPWYNPPKDLKRAFKALEEDSPRHLVAVMLGAAALSDAAFNLYQPDDSWSTTVSLSRQGDEGEEDAPEGALPPSAILFALSDHTLLTWMARAMGVPEALDEAIFYLHRGDMNVDLPPEEDEPEEWLTPTFDLLKIVVRVLRRMVGFELVVPLQEGQDGAHHVTYGWHAQATRGALSGAFAESGLVPLPLELFLSAARGTLESEPPPARLDFCRTAIDEDREGPGPMAHILDGGPPPHTVDLDDLTIWLLALDPRDLPGKSQKRLKRLVERVLFEST